ncbi:hypothetical protein C8R44DRAFT_879056 [Mycena epipterygia]|nr:hypothetical protein C8R44DRAFT_879056 [Mycena epipterygia]
MSSPVFAHLPLYLGLGQHVILLPPTTSYRGVLQRVVQKLEIESHTLGRTCPSAPGITGSVCNYHATYTTWKSSSDFMGEFFISRATQLAQPHAIRTAAIALDLRLGAARGIRDLEARHGGPPLPPEIPPIPSAEPLVRPRVQAQRRSRRAERDAQIELDLHWWMRL